MANSKEYTVLSTSENRWEVYGVYAAADEVEAVVDALADLIGCEAADEAGEFGSDLRGALSEIDYLVLDGGHPDFADQMNAADCAVDYLHDSGVAFWSVGPER